MSGVNPQERKCPNCGTVETQGFSHCAHCGRDLDNGDAKYSCALIMLVILGVSMLVVGGCSIVSAIGYSSEKSNVSDLYFVIGLLCILGALLTLGFFMSTRGKR